MLLDADDSQLVLIDYQEKLMPVIHEHALVTANALRLAQLARLMDVPVFGTEQNPSRLGGNVPAIRELCDRTLEKMSFSAVPDGRKQARAATVAALAQSFAHRLAAECAVVPLQWFNFYDFWGDEADGQNRLLPPQH